MSNTANNSLSMKIAVSIATAILAYFGFQFLRASREARQGREAEFMRRIEERDRLRRAAVEAWEKDCLDTHRGEIFVPVPGRSKRFCIPKGTILSIED